MPHCGPCRESRLGNRRIHRRPPERRAGAAQKAFMFSLNKLADRNFVIGFLLPVLIFSVATATLFRDVKSVSDIYKSILEEKSFTSLTIVVLAIWSCAT